MAKISFQKELWEEVQERVEGCLIVIGVPQEDQVDELDRRMINLAEKLADMAFED